jgi:hypothetical protein
MRRLFYLLTAAWLFAWVACKPAAKEPATAEVPGTLRQMVMLRHPVADFPVWLAAFDAHDSARVAAGLEAVSVGRSLEDTNMVNIVMMVSDPEKARAFAASPDLKTRMDSAGVTAPPTMMWIDLFRDDTTRIATPDRLTIAHKVKDVGVWLAAYDADKPNRDANGLVDRALARDASDSTLIYVHLAVTDLDKARAFAASEGLKQTMTTAGVEGAPSLFWYRKVR